MTIEQMTFAIMVLNSLVVPCLAAVARLLWRTEKRLLRIELRLGISKEV